MALHSPPPSTLQTFAVTSPCPPTLSAPVVDKGVSRYILFMVTGTMPLTAKRSVVVPQSSTTKVSATAGLASHH